ncbi:MAG: hypothetical protein M1511_12810 [Deltaproteobacteria bacterium]|nr:hypothetical protein [Deltaproteobacteria bacterium]
MSDLKLTGWNTIGVIFRTLGGGIWRNAQRDAAKGKEQQPWKQINENAPELDSDKHI